MPASYTVAQYLHDLRAIRNTGSATAETSFYPPLDRLFNAVGEALKPRVLFSTQLRNGGAGMPDGGFFPQPTRNPRNTAPPTLTNPERGVVEIKPAGYSLDNLTNEPQTRRYLQQYGLVLITNLHEFRLIGRTVDGTPRMLERYVLAVTPDDLWYRPIDPKHNDLFPDFLKRVMLYKVPLSQPKDVAWLLASYAREARARAEDHDLPAFRNVKLALEQSLGIQFEGDKGEHFFRSTLVQTLFYGIFSAWVLWRHSPKGKVPNAHFEWRLADGYLRVPILRKLFREVSDTYYLNTIQLTEILDLAGEALNRVDPQLFDIFQGERAVAYFYEPFLQAFDPQLRKDLGVWYTPREIVHYMVERVDHLLRTELSQPLGLASPAVRILDPCCGTGAYLTAVLGRIHRTLLHEAGDDTALVPAALRTAALTRVFGFEIMPAPFVIAHMEIARLLEDAGAPVGESQRAGIFLTNALTGWIPVEHPKVIFEEMEKEREAADDIKQQGTILVILGNPPYNGYAGIAKIEEERNLTTAYRAPVAGLPPPQGQGLNDLYIRFFRIAERRIASNRDSQGIVSFISNNAWLDGLSHTTMRHHYLETFQQIFIDNLNGDKYRTGKTTPEGKPDPSAFSTPQNREGIQVGTAIATLVRRPLATLVPTGGVVAASTANDAIALSTRPTATRLSVKSATISPATNDGVDAASAKGLASLPGAKDIAPTPSTDGATTLQPGPKAQENSTPASPRAVSAAQSAATHKRPVIQLRDIWGGTKLAQLKDESEGKTTSTYKGAMPATALGLPFANRAHSVDYTSWPRLPELFPLSFPGIKTSRDPLVVDIDRDRLEARMRKYFDRKISFEEFASLLPEAMKDGYMYDAKTIRSELQQRGFRSWEVLRYCYRPFDLRWIYWEPETSLLRRKVGEFAEQMIDSTFWVEARQRESGDAFARGTVTRNLADNFGNGLSNFFPAVAIDSAASLLSHLHLRPNLSIKADAYACSLAADVMSPFFHSIASLHTPAYRTENAGALLGDWPRIPLPATADLLAASAVLGRRLADLLDPESNVQLTREWSFLAALKRPSGNLKPEHLQLTAGWGSRGKGSTVMPGRGKAIPRPWTAVERDRLATLAATQSLTLEAALTLLGDTCLDIHLNGNSLWSAVPANVWTYTLGGYQVLKKWLSYRELPLLGRPLHPEESDYFADVVRRISAILLMGPALDASYAAILPTATGLPT